MSKHGIALAVIVTVLTAQSAAAETAVPVSPEPVTFLNEATGEECSDVTITNHVAEGSCEMHATSTGGVDLVAHTVFGETVAGRCLNEYEGAANSGGEGWIGLNQIAFSSPPTGGIDCAGAGAVRPCTEAEAAALGIGHSADWHLQAFEDHSDGSLWAAADICLANVSSLNSAMAGRLWSRSDVDPGGHQTSETTTDVRLGQAEGLPNSIDAEFSGAGTLEMDGGHGTVEVVH